MIDPFVPTKTFILSGVKCNQYVDINSDYYCGDLSHEDDNSDGGDDDDDGANGNWKYI